MEIQKYNVELKFITPILGSLPASKEVFTKFIQSKARDLDPEQAEEEIESIADLSERGVTQFYRRDGKPCLKNYQVKGFLQEAANTLKDQWPRKKKGSDGEGFATYLSTQVKRYVFIGPTFIPLNFNGEVTWNERPLRGMTQQGPRTSLAKSEQIEDATINFQIEVMTISGIKEEHLQELLSYGKYCGLGQWRSGSYGSFEVVKFEAASGKPRGIKALRSNPYEA
jgi:hypothetical protein